MEKQPTYLKQKMKRFTVDIPEEHYDALNKQAANDGNRAIGSLVRVIIQKHLSTSIDIDKEAKV